MHRNDLVRFSIGNIYHWSYVSFRRRSRGYRVVVVSFTPIDIVSLESSGKRNTSGQPERDVMMKQQPSKIWKESNEFHDDEVLVRIHGLGLETCRANMVWLINAG